MNAIEISLGESDVVTQFLRDVTAAPGQIRELVLVSPFVQLCSRRRGGCGRRLCELLASVHASGGEAILISDDTPSRRRDFDQALQTHRGLAGTLYLCERLHAKCGFATNSVGSHVAFMGSANLTDAGLNRNAEIVLGLKGRPLEGHGWRLLGQLRSAMDRIRSHAIEFRNN